MGNKIKKILSMVLIGIMVGAIPAVATTMTWDGRHGVDSKGVPKSLNPGDCANQPANTIMWIFNPGKDNTVSNPTITVAGTTGNLYSHPDDIYKFVSPYTAGQSLSGVVAVVTFDGNLGNKPVLTITHGCTGTTEIPEFPTVALPIAGVIGLLFFFQHKKRKEE